MPLNVSQSKLARDALMKAIYVNLFDWLVRRINLKIEPVCYLGGNLAQKYIGILDMPGFGKIK